MRAPEQTGALPDGRIAVGELFALVRATVGNGQNGVRLYVEDDGQWFPHGDEFDRAWLADLHAVITAALTPSGAAPGGTA